MRYKWQYLYLLVAISLGILSHYLKIPGAVFAASIISNLFLNFLQLLALPVIFFAVLATITEIGDLRALKNMGRRIFTYTLSTTLVAGCIALALFILIDPCADVTAFMAPDTDVGVEPSGKNYWGFFVKIIPPNLVQAFLEYNVIGIVAVAAMIGIASLSLDKSHSGYLHQLFKSLFSVFLNLSKVIAWVVPLAIWSFVVLFMQELDQGALDLGTLGKYLMVVVGANLLQGGVVLPLFLKMKGVSTRRLFQSMHPALLLAFFSKSSNATLPVSIDCMKNRYKTKTQVADISLPLCSVINMNACAGFILSTVLFVSISHGMEFTYPEMLVWVLISTLAAIGNAGVPMGCYFLTGALLTSMGVPLKALGIILPFYAFLDMLETAINIWSDSCITAVVDKEMYQEAA